MKNKCYFRHTKNRNVLNHCTITSMGKISAKWKMCFKWWPDKREQFKQVNVNYVNLFTNWIYGFCQIEHEYFCLHQFCFNCAIVVVVQLLSFFPLNIKFVIMSMEKGSDYFAHCKQFSWLIENWFMSSNSIQTKKNMNKSSL